MVKRSCAAELVADAVGLGDVGHRGHPAGLLAVGVDQGRNVQAGIEQLPFLRLHPHLDAPGTVLPLQFFLQAEAWFAVAGRASRKRGRAAHQLGFDQPVIWQKAALT